MSLLNAIKLLLPALIPSWNFFDVIAPSPRIQFTLLNNKKSVVTDWQEFRPRPENMSVAQILKRMIWNPKWNESLFLVSCAERIIDDYTEHSESEILNRIEQQIHKKNEVAHLQFRLILIHREGSELKKDVLFISRIQELIKENNNDS